MTMRLLFEEESGSSTGRRHPHNGYYAGDFAGRTDAAVAPTRPTLGQLPLRLLPGTGPTAPSDVTAPSERAA
jgi:hypothetical protein